MKIFLLAAVIGFVLLTSGCATYSGCASSYYYYPKCYLSDPVISTSTTDVYYYPPIPDVYYVSY